MIPARDEARECWLHSVLDDLLVRHCALRRTDVRLSSAGEDCWGEREVQRTRVTQGSMGVLTDADFAASAVVLLGQHGDTWQDTAAELLALLPGAAADASRISRRLSDAVVDLAARGVVVARRREPGTGRRLVTLRPQFVLPVSAAPGKAVRFVALGDLLGRAIRNAKKGSL